MAHMTKKHKEILLEQYLAEQEAMESAEYLPKLLRVLDAARELGYTLKAQAGELQLREYSWRKPVTLSAEYSRKTWRS